MTLDEMLRHRVVRRTTERFDAAERYYCDRSGRTLWVEDERPSARSSRGAPRYLVDNGDGSRVWYSGEDLDRALAKLVTFSKHGRRAARSQAGHA